MSAEVEMGAVAEATSNDEALRQCFAGISGLDIDYGLGMVRGNLTKYTQLAVLFADGYHQYADRIPQLLAVGDLGAIETLAHTLRGSAGMLGAIAVADAAGTLLFALHVNTAAVKIIPLCNKLAEDLENLTCGIRRAAELAKAVEEDQAVRFTEVLERLQLFLERGDIAASYLARDQAGLLRIVLGEAAIPLLSRIEAFDYQDAAVELHKLVLLPKTDAPAKLPHN